MTGHVQLVTHRETREVFALKAMDMELVRECVCLAQGVEQLVPRFQAQQLGSIFSLAGALADESRALGRSTQ